MHWLLPIFLSAVLILLTPTPIHGSLIPKSTKVRCPNRVLKGGRVRLRSKGRVIRYTCLRGYQLLGNRYSTCVRGTWDLPAPVCIKDGCDSFTVPHGQVMETYRGAFATVHCDPGYSLVGNQGLYCNGAVWNDTLPTCREIGGFAQKECDFENEDLCGWSHDANQDFTWKRHNFATPSGYAGTGPSFDHTLGRGLNGHYMYLESSSPRLENDTARLYSPVFKVPNNESSCFIFWYHMFGHTTGSLNVYIHGKDSDLLFSKSGDQGDQWHEAVLPLPTVNSSFQILMEGVRGGGYEGDIAIDDVKLAGGDECSVPTSSNDNMRVSDDSSCENRCLVTATDPSVCECTPDCIANNTCCVDYLQMCDTTTEVSEWPTTQSEMEVSTTDDISMSDMDFSSTMANPTTSKANTHPLVKITPVNTAFLPSTGSVSVQNVTPFVVYVTPMVPTIASPDKTNPTATTSRAPVLLLNTTLPKHFTIKLQRNDSSTTAASSRTQHYVNSFLNSTPTNTYYPTAPTLITEQSKKAQKQEKFSSGLLNPSFTNTTQTIPVTVTKYGQSTFKVVQPTTNLIFVGILNHNETLTTRSILERKKSLLSTERIPTTHNLTTVIFDKQTKSSPAHPIDKNTRPAPTMRPVVDRTDSRPTYTRIISLTNSNVTSQTYPRWPILIRPTKKPFPLTSSSMRTNQIFFNTPPPDIEFRTPKSVSIQQPSTVLPNRTTVSLDNTHSSSQLNPKYQENLAKNKKKSKNDVLHQGWEKQNSTLQAFNSGRSTSIQDSTSSVHTSTSSPATSTEKNSHSTVLSFDYDDTVENNWRSKFQTINKVSAPNIAPLTSSSSSSGTKQILVCLVAVMMVLTTVLVSVCVVRRRRIHRRVNEDDELDIRFLPPDEMLDFTLARPEVFEEKTL